MTIKDRAGNLVHCPDCQSTNVRYANSFHILDFWMWLRKMHSLRCRNCHSRFYERTDEAKNVMWVK